jgi:hypothetical protein
LSVRAREAVSSTDADETLHAPTKPFYRRAKTAGNTDRLSMPPGQQWSSIMWHVIISLIYRQACRRYLAAARKQRAWA